MKLSLKIAAPILLVISLATGCSTAWWQAIQTDPVAYVTQFDQQVEIILSTSNTIFNAIRPFIPADKVAQVEQAFTQAVLAVNHALAALNAAVQAAVDAQTANPDFSKFIADVVTATDQVIAIINEFRTGGSHVAAMQQVQGYASAFDDLNAMKTLIDRYKK